MFQKIIKKFCFKDNLIENNIKEVGEYEEIIVPFYLNQRIVYDTLAIINDGFTELYNVSNANNNSNLTEGMISAKLDTSGNPLTFMSANIGSEVRNNRSNENKQKEEFKKIHTPTSLFSKIYKYLCKYKMLKRIEKAEDINKLQCGDFVEFHTKLTVNTIEEMFRKMEKMCNIGEIFISFAEQNKKIKGPNVYKDIGKKIGDLIKFLDIQNERIKYLVGKIENKDIVIKIDKNNIIDADYDQINNGDFRIIGKVLEIVAEGKKVSLNRESVLGLIKEEGLQPMKEAFKGLGNTMFEIPEEIIDEIEGKTIIVIPIVIGI